MLYIGSYITAFFGLISTVIKIRTHINNIYILIISYCSVLFQLEAKQRIVLTILYQFYCIVLFQMKVK